jgi:LDH2 family malate/lactate/ureidoglycolate dehydrogenase
VLVAGDPEAAARKERLANGVPLDEETIEQLTALAAELGLEMPRAIGAA